MHAVTPVVDVTASRIRVNIGASTMLFCNVTRTNPGIANYTWMDEDTSTRFNIGSTDMLNLALLSTQDFGTISCTATNAAGISGKANVTIEQGCKLLHYSKLISDKSFHAVSPEIAVAEPEPVFFNEPVQLICTVVGGDPPRSIIWTASNGTQVYSTNCNQLQGAGANVSLTITRYD